ncbi:MAG TPA: hypothetical protein VKD72_25045 [Gemmataceae bacterium]|nr:hypothetical protein [Gemmataceae bacterium]
MAVAPTSADVITIVLVQAFVALGKFSRGAARLNWLATETEIV